MRKLVASPELRPALWSVPDGVSYPCAMAAPYFKEWRKYRQLTQEQVVDRLAAMDDPELPTTAASLSRLENGKQSMNHRIIAALAEIYDVEPDHLLGRNPFKEGEVIDFFARMPLPEQQRALAILKAVNEAGGR
jgi:transcriptional regulator with XRE-family HTH domain